MKRAFSFPADRVTLPKGTRVVLVVARVDETGVKQRAGVLATVREADGDRYTIETPAGSVLHVERDAIQLQREDLLESIARRQHDHARYAEHIVLEVTVGSRAWGLAHEASDEDLRGCFVLPFDDAVGIFDAPDEIAAGEGQYWEIEKLVRQALRADPNTLETLWSPLVKRATPIGQRLIDERAIFSSLHVLGSFGRYAQSQLKKLERTQLRHEQLARLVDAAAAGADDARLRASVDDADEVHALVRSLFDRGLIRASSLDALRAGVAELGAAALKPEPVRPKNAYNLVRLLASARHWLTEGTPLIRVEGALRDELLRIKQSEVPLEDVLARAEELAREVEECARTCTKLPRDPNVERAHALLVDARRASVTRAVPASLTVAWAARTAWSDVDCASVRRFVEPLVATHGKIIALALSGAHAYGFPSPDSDLDLKAIHVVPAARVLGLQGAPAPLEHVAIFEGKEMDVSSHELGQACELLLKGNGNMLERVLARIALVDTPLLSQLVDATKRNLSRRLAHHYRGFFQQMLREMEKERAGFAGGAKAKRLLYAYRVALTGVHALRVGAIEPDVRELAPLYGYADDVRVLIERKQVAELAVLTEAEAAPLVARLPALDAALTDALARSVLPEAPGEPGALEDVLVEGRRAAESSA